MAKTSTKTDTKTENYHVINMPAAEVEKRLFKTKELDLVEASKAVEYIKVTVGYPIEDGSSVRFQSPADCSEVIGITVSYPSTVELTESDSEKTFTFTDAHGHDVSDISELFRANVAVEAILHDLNSDSPKAYVLNADTNAYLENKFATIANQLNNAPTLISWADGDTYENLEKGVK